VTCNGTNASLSSGNFSCNISLNVGVNLIVVRATDLAGNVAGSNFHVSLSGTLPPPQSLTVTPVSATLVVGQTQQLVAVDELGRPRPDATWSVSDPTIATISGDPTLTLIAPGPFTLTATVGGVSTSTRWNAATGPLPLGTVQWSAPIAPGANVTQMVQAEPVSGGPDLYSVEMNPNTGDTTIRALAADGTQLWSQPFPGTHASAIADGNGGILISYQSPTPNSNYTPIVDLDAQTGGTLWENDSVYLQGQQSDLAALEAVAPNGSILAAGISNYSLDPNTGVATKLQPANTPQGFLKYIDPCGGPAHTAASPYTTAGSEDGRGASVAADGTIFQVVSTLDFNFLSGCQSLPTSISLKMYLSQTAPDGSATFALFDTESSLVPDSWPYVRPVYVPDPKCYACTTAGYIPPNQNLPFNVFFQVVPDGQGGAFVPWWRDLGNFPHYEAHLSHVSRSAVTDVVFPLTYQNTAFQNSNPCPSPYFRPGLPCTTDFRLVLGENGVAFATDLKSVVAFNIATMAPLWTHSSASGMDIVAATADGGVTINDFQQGLIPLDANGNTVAMSNRPLAQLFSYSWGSQWYMPLTSGGPLAAITLPVAVDAADLWATPAGNASGTNSADALCDCLVETPDPAPPPPTCLICNLPPPTQAPSCTSTAGALSTYLILVGDSSTSPTGDHNVGNLFNLAAQPQANSLQTQGHPVVACRVSTIQHLQQALTLTGLTLDGGVFFFGHAAFLQIPGTNSFYSLLSVGQQNGDDANVSFKNVGTLSNTHLGPNVTITLNACNAGLSLTPGQAPIAQLIANQLRRTVYAHHVGMYFSQNPNDTHRGGIGQAPNSLPMYMLPQGGVPKPNPTQFSPQ
jgi:Bacterial Ig-like domain (group 2)